MTPAAHQGLHRAVTRQVNEHVHRDCESNQMNADAAPGLDRLIQGGRPLSPVVRAYFEPRFGRDFGQVRVQTSRLAETAAATLNARAFTIGNVISFAAGNYSPQTGGGAQLLAHDLTHVVQQGSAAPTPASLPNAGRAAGESTTATLVQRQGDPAQAPPGLACPVATNSAGNTTNQFAFGTSQSELSPAQKSEIQQFISDWHASGGTAKVRVDGYASVDGPEPLNWTLSCDRAMAVASELTSPSAGLSLGIPSQNITYHAHGETGQFSDTDPRPNRRATISMIAPVPTPAPPPVCTPPPCPDPPAGFQAENPGIASGALCRGACGADCDPDACTAQAPHVLCIPDSTGTCHRTCTYTVLECGSHPACVTHDACYDACAVAGETDLCHQGGTCHCSCDMDCANAHGLWTCGRWAAGHGPQPNTIRFTGAPVASGVLTGVCGTP